MFPIFSASASAIALISRSMERSVHGGVHCENCIAKACHMAKLWRFEWGQVRLELFWKKAGRSWSLEKLQSPFFFELIAKLTDAISCTESKSLCVVMVIEQRVLWPALPASRPIDKLQTIVLEPFLWVRPGASGALLEKSWSFLVPGEATKPILFRVDC